MNLTHLWTNLDRVRQVAAILAKYGLADWLGTVSPALARKVLRGREVQRLAEGTREHRIRLALTELGTTYIKLGQILSTRADLVGPSLALELAHLQTQTPPDPPEAVQATIEAELKRPLGQLFARFEGAALASASIGQVHRAWHHDGRPLVVKVQRAGIGPKVRSDLEILTGLARLAELHPDLKRYRPLALADEYGQTLLRELDFARECRHLQQFRNHFADDPTVYFPEPLPELSGGRVLTMERLDGVSLNDPKALDAALGARGVDRDGLARRGATVYLQMIFRDGFYHADPHPGNILVLPGGRIGMLDCGMVGRMDERLRDAVEGMLLSVVRGDAERLTRLIVRLCSAPAGVDESALSNDVAEFLSYHGSQPLDRFELGKALTEMTEMVRRHHLLMPGRVSLLIKVLVMLEGTARLLNPRFNLLELIEPFRRTILRRRLSPRRQLRKLQQVYGEWAGLLEGLPRDLTGVLEQLREGKLDVHLQHRRLQPSVNRLVLGMMTSALFLGSVVLWSRDVPPLLAGTSVFGVVGCAVSLFLGFRLLRAIARSGHLDSLD